MNSDLLRLQTQVDMNVYGSRLVQNCPNLSEIVQIDLKLFFFLSDINRAISPSTNSDLLRLQTQAGMNVNSYGLVTGNQNEGK